MKCPPHVADDVVYEPQYKVIITTGQGKTLVAYQQKKCALCKEAVIILAPALLAVLERDGYELEVEMI